jgi:hypothetical protein
MKRGELAVGLLASAGAVAFVTAAIAVLKPYVPVLSLPVLYEFAVLPVAVLWGLALKFRLLSEPGVVVADVPVVEGSVGPAPTRLVARVLVSAVNAASMRAVNYAQTLDVDDVRAVHFAFSPADAREIRDEWRRHGPRIPLEVDDAPYRDVGLPLLGYLRDLTAEAGTEVLVLMPELYTRGWRRLLHNQKALYVKRLLLFEPHVILASVPYQLLR